MTKAKIDKPLDKSAGYQMWLASNAWQRLVRKVLEPFDLTHAQFAVLAFIDRLSRSEEFVTQALISRHADIDENMASQIARASPQGAYSLESEIPRMRELDASGSTEG